MVNTRRELLKSMALGSAGLRKVELQDLDGRRKRVGGLEVHADDAPLGPDALGKHLEPGARPAAQVDDGRAAPELRRAAQQVLELEGRA